MALIFCFLITSLGVLRSQELPIFDIARNGTLEELKSAIKENPNSINTENDTGYTPLALACYYGNNEVAKYLIDRVQNIDATSNYGTPLMAATIKNNKELVTLLLKKDVNVNISDPNGTTALHYAVIFNFEEIAVLLIKAQADTTLKDNRGNSALDYAKLSGRQKIIQLLKQQ